MAKNADYRGDDDLKISHADLPAFAPVVKPAMEHVRKRTLTPKMISLAHTPHINLVVTGELIEEKMEGFARSESGTVPLLPITNLDTGETGLLICPAVLCNVLDRLVNYVGMRFEIQSGDPRPGKGYRDVQVWEIE